MFSLPFFLDTGYQKGEKIKLMGEKGEKVWIFLRTGSIIIHIL